jgi:large subunit ribosomal protein L15
MQLPAIVKPKRRRGRGLAGGGKKSGRGMKGQRSRAGSIRRAGFEGGQTPLYQRLPKGRGTKQRFASQVAHPAAVTLRQLKRFAEGSIVGIAKLREAGLVGRAQDVKLIGTDALDRKLTVRVHTATDAARKAVEQAGGKVEIIKRHV